MFSSIKLLLVHMFFSNLVGRCCLFTHNFAGAQKLKTQVQVFKCCMGNQSTCILFCESTKVSRSLFANSCFPVCNTLVVGRFIPEVTEM